MTVNVTATNYNALSKGVTLTSSQSLDFQLAPTPVFTVAGVGNTVIDIPDTVLRLQVTGTYSASSSNFIPWLGPHNVACGSVISSGCHLLVNELLGAFYGQTSYTATVLTGAGGTTGLNSISITNSSGVAWTFTEVR